MEKKKCPQCKNLILITSPTCLYCGRPNKFITKEYVNKKWNKDSNKNEFDYIFTNKYLVFILILNLIFFIYLISSDLFTIIIYSTFFFKKLKDFIIISILIESISPNNTYLFLIFCFFINEIFKLFFSLYSYVRYY